MAWIESHQELGAHPKTRKLATMLGIHRMQVVGHLHALWWWALDYAEDGDLSQYDAADVALGAEWDGDPDEFVGALIDCGPGDKSGFLEADMLLHDWHDYAGKLVERRRKDRERKAQARGQSTDRPADVPRTGQGSPRSGVRTQPNPTVPTSPNGDGALFEAFFEFWQGRPYDSGASLTKSERGRLNQAVKEAHDAGIDPGEVSRRGERYRRDWPAMERTPQALLLHWSRFDGSSDPPAPFDPDNCTHPEDRRAVVDGDEFCGACGEELARVV